MSVDHLVLGAAVGLSADQVTPFLASVRSSGYSGDVVLFVDVPLARRLRRDPSAVGVELVSVRRLLPVSFRRLRSSRLARLPWGGFQVIVWTSMKTAGRLPVPDALRRKLQVGLALLVCTPMESRFLRYRQLLATRPYKRVLIADVRDVLFQSDPFAQLPLHGLAVSIETRRYTVATQPHNSAWIRQAYGEDALRRIGANPVSCVGVTYGDSQAISAYLELVTDEILRLPARAARRGGADTAVHNFLLWTGRLGAVSPLETLASPVATLNGISPDEVSFSPAGHLLNEDGSEPSVLHQYDRVPGAAGMLLRSLVG